MDVIGHTAPVMDVIGREASTGGTPGATEVLGRSRSAGHFQFRQGTTHNLRIEQTPIHAVLPQDRDARTHTSVKDRRFE
jgi:hypothetical protein